MLLSFFFSLFGNDRLGRHLRVDDERERQE